MRKRASRAVEFDRCLESVGEGQSAELGRGGLVFEFLPPEDVGKRSPEATVAGASVRPVRTKIPQTGTRIGTADGLGLMTWWLSAHLATPQRVGLLELGMFA